MGRGSLLKQQDAHPCRVVTEAYKVFYVGDLSHETKGTLLVVFTFLANNGARGGVHGIVGKKRWATAMPDVVFEMAEYCELLSY